MDCRRIREQIGAFVDGELLPRDRQEVASHLSACSACSAEADALRRQHAALSLAFSTPRARAAAVAERAIGGLCVSSARRVRPPWLAISLSAAAGFALALVLFGPFKESRRQMSAVSELPRTSAAVARLALATGPVEVRPSDRAAWSVVSASGPIAAGSHVRTGAGVQCELRTTNDSRVRLNAQTEVVFDEAHRINLVCGQMWSGLAPADRAFEVRAPEATVTAMGTQFDLLVEPTATLLTVLEGQARVSARAGTHIVAAGERARIVAGAVVEKSRVEDLVLATRWVHELLVLKGRDDPELGARVDTLLARVGATKMSLLYEQEIRALGDGCVPPLTRFVRSLCASPDSCGLDRKCSDAARILADVAEPRSIPDLIDLLGCEDGQVRVYAALALQRLTSLTQGLAPEQWGERPCGGCDTAYLVWRQWWQENKHRYPGVS